MEKVEAAASRNNCFSRCANKARASDLPALSLTTFRLMGGCYGEGWAPVAGTSPPHKGKSHIRHAGAAMGRHVRPHQAWNESTAPAKTGKIGLDTCYDKLPLASRLLWWARFETHYRLSNRSPCFAGADADHRLPTLASQIQARDSTVPSWRSREKSRGRRRAPYRHRLAAGEHRQSGHLQLSALQPRYRLEIPHANNKSQPQR